jgi:hypothetical protein
MTRAELDDLLLALCVAFAVLYLVGLAGAS